MYGEPPKGKLLPVAPLKLLGLTPVASWLLRSAAAAEMTGSVDLLVAGATGLPTTEKTSSSSSARLCWSDWSSSLISTTGAKGASPLLLSGKYIIKFLFPKMIDGVPTYTSSTSMLLPASYVATTISGLPESLPSSAAFFG